MVSTRWRDNNFDRIACDFRSRSLDYVIRVSPIWVATESLYAHLSVVTGFMVNLHSARNTRKASLMKRSLAVSSCGGGASTG